MDMCRFLSQGFPPGNKIGRIDPDEGSIDYTHHLHQPDGPKKDIGRYETSLRALLRKDWSKDKSSGFSRKHRLNIAATLAMSVLQLDATLWLEERWNSDDVYFYCSQQHVLQPEADPYLRWSISPKRTKPEVQEGVDESSSSKMLLYLGVILVELCFGRCLTELQTAAEFDTDDISTEKDLAKRLLSKVYDESGCRYGDAVRRCLDCPFDFRDLSFKNAKFQEAVYDTIVTPLMQDLQDFEGKEFG